MSFNTCIKIKRKGFNYYTDYINRYFEDAFSKQGFHLAKNVKQSEFTLLMYFDDSSWMSIVSNMFDDMA